MNPVRSVPRPGLDRLRDRAAEAAFDRFLVTDPDRIARSYVHQVLRIEELQKKGRRVEFLDRPMSQDPHDHSSSSRSAARSPITSEP